MRTADGPGPRLLVPGWERFQHYQKRNPPWIRLYRDLVDGDAENAYRWARLEPAAAKLLVEVWLVAAGEDPVAVNGDGRLRGQVPGAELLAWKLRRPEGETRELLQQLVLGGWLLDPEDVLGCGQCASAPLEWGQRDAAPETETEAEAEAEGAPAQPAPPPGPQLPQKLNAPTDTMLSIPCRTRKGADLDTWWYLLPPVVGELQQAYPGVNVRQVAEDMRRKVESGAHPGYTKRGMRQALARWCDSEFKQQRSNKDQQHVGEQGQGPSPGEQLRAEVESLLVNLEAAADKHHAAGDDLVVSAIETSADAVREILEAGEFNTHTAEWLEALEDALHKELLETLETEALEDLDEKVEAAARNGDTAEDVVTRSKKVHRRVLTRGMFKLPSF